MFRMRSRWIRGNGFALLLAMATPMPVLAAVPTGPEVVQEHCMPCHGTAQRRGGLDLSTHEGLVLGGDSGQSLFVRDDSGESPLMARVRSEDPAERMPPSGPRLSEEEIDALSAWLDSGGGIAQQDSPPVEHEHWAFRRPEQAPVPAVSTPEWVRNPIDAFILARLDAEGLTPSPEASRRSLIRRVSLDLTGLPPTPEAVEVFAADERPDAYERLVDRLLASPHYGERRAMEWLDVARYADTHGYEKDRHRDIWPYRDWVIDAFNKDMPFDRFAIEQLAGDMLPNAGPAQRVATGFLRNSLINEEGGIDQEEFRYEAMVDRTNTVSTAFLGITMTCAQCHTHKYDPITQREYFQLMAFINNTDDVLVTIPDPDIERERAEIKAAIAQLEGALADAFPADDITRTWNPLRPLNAEAAHAELTLLEDHSVSAGDGPGPDKDRYIIEFEVAPGHYEALRLEVLSGTGDDQTPGRSPGGNFVVTDARWTLQHDGESRALNIAHAGADREQKGYEASHAIDGDAGTGWAIADGKPIAGSTAALTLSLAEPLVLEEPAVIRAMLGQGHGGHHTLRRLRVLGETVVEYEDPAPEAERRENHLARKQAAWEAATREKASDWRILDPVSMESQNRATLSRLDDRSILATGDQPDSDVYTVSFRVDAPRVTALRLEVLPHPSLPGGGPGRGTAMGEGDFLLSEIHLSAAPWSGPGETVSIPLVNATANYSDGDKTPALSLDGLLDTGWSVRGATGQGHRAVFELAEPLDTGGGMLLTLRLDQIYIHQHTIGRFRVAITGDDGPIEAAPVPDEVEAALLVAAADRTEADEALLRRHFLAVTPELAEERAAIESLRASLPPLPTSLALAERADARITHLHHRGEYLSIRDPVPPGVPAVLHPFPEFVTPNRLNFAHWLVDEANPLIGRVTMNRLWQSLFGEGIVTTPEDFGVRSAIPEHPELLDWLAVEFVRRGWSMKEMTRLMVTSAAYRQSSTVSPSLQQRDPNNALIARGPRFRLDAELLRDVALSVSGLLNDEMGGPSVFPPLPDGTLTIVYPGGEWAAGEDYDDGDRYRRGLYTYWKRTLPYPSMAVFDAPARDVSCVRRGRSNTPLQALTLLNDPVFVEAARAFAQRVLDGGGSDAERIHRAFMLSLSRPPDAEEMTWVQAFLEERRSGAVDPDADADAELQAWTLLCRVLLNLDETITKS